MKIHSRHLKKGEWGKRMRIAQIIHGFSRKQCGHVWSSRQEKESLGEEGGVDDKSRWSKWVWSRIWKWHMSQSKATSPFWTIYGASQSQRPYVSPLPDPWSRWKSIYTSDKFCTVVIKWLKGYLRKLDFCTRIDVFFLIYKWIYSFAFVVYFW